ncbi:MAG: hypothetical protein H8E36_11410 [Rhodospirillaceae bacterium]|nr:hypothetical protein [Rhodospirillaceae bacterium]MBL6940545.1 hypothetical protein [Rhodospirillales bacterium]
MRMTLFASFAIAFVLSMMSFQDARGETLMQCMEDCIQHEGGNSATNKATCKTRCGAKFVNPKPAGNRDCMGEFKGCNTSCGKEKIGNPSPCHKECKAQLKTCT